MFDFWREATAALVPGFLCQSGRRRPENVSILAVHDLWVGATSKYLSTEFPTIGVRVTESFMLESRNNAILGPNSGMRASFGIIDLSILENEWQLHCLRS